MREVGAYAASLRLCNELAPTQWWHSAELAPTQKLAPTLVLKNWPQTPVLTKLSRGVALTLTAAKRRLRRLVIETIFYILRKRASLGRTLQVPENRFLMIRAKVTLTDLARVRSFQRRWS
jgi:hypothetical protein